MSFKPTAPRKHAPVLRPQNLSERWLAAGVVNSVLLQGMSLTPALENLRRALPDAEPRLLAATQDLAYGVLRNLGRLRFYLAQLADRPLQPAELQGLMFVALHELDDGETPSYAAVNEAVELAGTHFPRARGFVNALLRNFLRRREALLANAEQDLEARWNFPRWWIDRLRTSWPQDWEHILTAQNTHPPMTLRVNTRRNTPEHYQDRLREAGIEARRTGADALTLIKPIPVRELPGFREGDVSVQDLGAQYAGPLLEAEPGMRVLDACAAPGGKTAHLLEMHDLELTALDVDVARLQRVQDTLTRLGLSAHLIKGDAGRPEAWWDGRLFDRILLDAPCTASGVVRRHPDGKWLKKPEDIDGLARQQRRLLDALWPLLRHGGTLLYATCSVFPEENTLQIEGFMQRHPDARLDPRGRPGTHAENRPVHADVLTPTDQLIPDSAHDGFFYARISKT